MTNNTNNAINPVVQNNNQSKISTYTTANDNDYISNLTPTNWNNNNNSPLLNHNHQYTLNNKLNQQPGSNSNEATYSTQSFNGNLENS